MNHNVYKIEAYQDGERWGVRYAADNKSAQIIAGRLSKMYPTVAITKLSEYEASKVNPALIEKFKNNKQIADY